MEPEEMRKLLKPYVQRRHAPLYMGLLAFVLFMVVPKGYWQEICFWLFIAGVFSWSTHEMARKDKASRKRASIALCLLAGFVLLILVLSVTS